MTGLPTWLSAEQAPALERVKAACRAVLEAETGPELLRAMAELEDVVLGAPREAQTAAATLFPGLDL